MTTFYRNSSSTKTSQCAQMLRDLSAGSANDCGYIKANLTSLLTSAENYNPKMVPEDLSMFFFQILKVAVDRAEMPSSADVSS